MNLYKLASYLFLLILLPSCYALRAYKYRKLDLKSHEKMPFVTVVKSETVHNYYEGGNENYPEVKAWLDSNLANTYTAAFLVIKNDSIVYEKYFDDYNSNTLLPSFSVMKSYVGTLTGIAAAEGKIKSLSQPITDYLPELVKQDNRFANITIQHLLDMRSGLKWSEGSYNLKDDAIKMGFRPNIAKQIKKIKIATAPTDYFDYKSINTLLLSIIINRATGVPLVKYFEEKLWKPLGATHIATLTTDKKGLPIAFAGLNANARDFALLGSVYLKGGQLNGNKVLTPDWVNSTTNPDTMYAYQGYKNQIWGRRNYKGFEDSLSATLYYDSITGSRKVIKGSKGSSHNYFVSTPSPIIYAEGILGQFIYVSPEKNMVIVRLGHYYKHPKYSLQTLLRFTEAKY